jgi:hypothetical protein
VGVEPTTRSAKERVTGFEGRESHRTLFASVRDYRVREGFIQTAEGSSALACLLISQAY